ncbi:MAG: tetratricopeptide repeat protein, partial [Deltaproteobacteria bacterium]|nr:tetratricopeptide repeat protein [Deltaproteobacteria bacterium]
ERALDKVDGSQARPDEVETVGERARRCRLELARARLSEADALVGEGEMQRALENLEDAAEICDDPEIAEAVADRKQRYEAEEARRLLGEEQEMTEEDLLAVMAGTWTEDQADEYAELPDEFRQALLARQDQDLERAAELFAKVIESKELEYEPRYAYVELASTLAALGRNEEALQEFDRFLEATDGDDEALEVRTAALTAKGRTLLDLERPEDAEEQLLEATRLAPESHVTFLNLGVFLRSRNDLERSLKALRTAVELMGQMHPDFRVIREMGLTYLAMDRKQEAEETLYAVVEHHASRGTHDQLDPVAVITLAKLYEEKNELDKASDLYRHLAQGYDSANHFVYNLEAARLLGLAEADPSLVERYLTRAAELAREETDIERVDRLRSGESD